MLASPLTRLPVTQSVAEADWPLSDWCLSLKILYITVVEVMYEELIAPCGMNCGLCSSYLAMRNDLKKKGFGKTYCAGCLPGGKNCHYKRQCELLTKRIVRFCYECRDFPCRRLNTLDKRYRTFYHMSMIENLEYIKKHGMEMFLKKEMTKWRCPECGGVICCHNGLCYKCQLDELRQKKHKYRWEER